MLPLDDVKGHFDNDAASLQVSPNFIDQYVSAAREIAQAGRGRRRGSSRDDHLRRHREHGDFSESRGPLPAPAGSSITLKGCLSVREAVSRVKHSFPADGEYELTIGDMALAREVPKMEFENTVLALLDGKEFYRTNIGGERDHKAIDQRLDVAVAEINGRLRKIHFKATAGQHDLTVTFLHRSYAESDERVRTTTLEGGQERIQAVHALQIRGPLTVTGMSDSRQPQENLHLQAPGQGRRDAPVRAKSSAISHGGPSVAP